LLSAVCRIDRAALVRVTLIATWYKMLSTSTIASLSIEIEIGTPYQQEPDVWRCPVALNGLYDRLAEAAGIDSFQALCLAISLVQELLQGFCADGGKLLQDGEGFSLQGYSFGAAVRRRP
jgi:hypothetical protein